LPYTQKLFDEFQKRFGYDLKEKLPELFLQVEDRSISRVKWHYVELLQQLFLENFAIPCKEWCDKHNLILTGHVLHEDNLTAQTAMSGSMMRYYEHMSSPGVDVLGEHNKNYWIVKQLASAARQTGKKQLLSELYGCTGWQMPFAGHKAVGDWQALLGINLRCHHLSWYTMRGEAKRDYPASILHQSAWYKEYKHIEDYFARFGFLMAQGEPVCDLLVINPVETFWAQVHLGWSKNLALQDEHLQTLEKHYQTLFTWLLESQIDFDYGDEAMMARLCSIEGNTLRVGYAKYKTVLISGMETIRSSTLELLKQFEAAGGKIIVAGETPSHIDALPAEFPMFGKIEFTKESVLAAVPEPQAVVDAPDIFGQLRKTDAGLLFAALNVNRDERRENVTVRIRTDLPISEWNCETGQIFAVETETSNGWKIFTTDFPKGGQKLWIASESFQTLEKNIPSQGDCFQTLEISGPFEYALSEPNICVLDAAEYRIDGGEWQPELDVLKIDQKIRDAHGILRRGGEMLQPWFTAQHPVKELCDVELRYTFEIETLPEWIDLVIEEPENFTVEINGHPLNLSQSERWIDIAFHRIRIPAEFPNLGKNEIVLKTRYRENSNLEAVYLLGDFGVTLEDAVRKIIPMPGKLDVGDICPQGFPFYSGAITYRIPLPGGAQRLHLPSIGGACVKVNGQILGWDPFEADVSGDSADVEIILTRRNTFGPLHDRLDPRGWIGPHCFITEGAEFSSAPILTPEAPLHLAFAEEA
ncbi:MAG: glycosyl hydrolase, partial [Kiritimatiellales bacterium]